jgi:hypothetical protein
MIGSQFFLLFVLIFWIIFAIYSEYQEQQNAYILGIPKDTDSIHKSLSKLEKCISYDIKTIKWRRAYLVSNLITVFLFLFVIRKIPTPSEYLLYLIIISTGYIFMWSHYVETTSKEVLKYTKMNIYNIKENIKKNHSFILPF